MIFKIVVVGPVGMWITGLKKTVIQVAVGKSKTYPRDLWVAVGKSDVRRICPWLSIGPGSYGISIGQKKETPESDDSGDLEKIVKFSLQHKTKGENTMEWSLSKKDLDTFKVIEEFRSGAISREIAAAKLGIHERSIQRKAKKIRQYGIEGLLHGNKGKMPANKINDQIKQKILNLYKEKYFDFNFAHAYEFMQNEEALSVSYSTFKNWCRKLGLGKVRKRRSSKRRLARERAANEGLMWLLDGSPERWNGEDEWCMISLIDDATSKIPGAEFYESETTWACMQVVRKAIEKNGIPEFIVTDQAGWSTGSIKRQHFSQFVRACQELSIKVIAVNSPEAKGRIERSFRTDQDRLIPEMRLHGIKSMLDANRYLQQVYLPEWDKKRSVEARSETSRYKPMPLNMDLNEIFCIKQPRIVNRDQTIQYNNERYRIENKELGNLWKKQIVIHEYKNETFSMWYGHKKLTLTKMSKPLRKWKRAS